MPSSPASTPTLSTTLAWTASTGAFSYALYRGSVGPGGWVFNHACRLDALDASPASDPEVPAPGALFYYLISGRNACGEGPLGETSDIGPRPNPSPC